MKKHKLLSLLMAMVLAVTTLVLPAAAAGGARLVTSGQAAASQSVGFTGLSVNCQSLQVTFTLSEPSGSYDFAVDSDLAALPGAYTTWQQDQTSGTVTVYVTLKSGVLTQSGSLTLGTISSTSGSAFTVKSASGMKLLGSDYGETTYDSVSQSGATGGVTTWPITIADTAGGRVTASSARAVPGQLITLTALPESGYVLDSLTAADGTGKALSLTSAGSGKYTFVMPASAVSVRASFVLDGQPASPFADVPAGSWYYDAVQYVYEAGLMGGTGNGQFSPALTTSRGMIVTILYRLEGSPAVSGSAVFSDVAPGQWYADAVEWASANGIVTGYGAGKFGPNDTITREQMAAILYRYAAYKGCDVTGQADLTGYADAGQVSAYAVGPMAWAVDAGLIGGTSSTTLSPRGSATRAQAAVILTRLCQSLAG